MTRITLTLSEANDKIQALVGLPVSLPWMGYGTAIFLELGELKPLTRPRQRHQNGDASICLYSDWRVEEGAKICFGSSNSKPVMSDGIEQLQNVFIEKFVIHGQVPELQIQFSNGQQLITAGMIEGDSDWQIRMSDSTWISCRNGVVGVGEGEALGLTDEEEIIFRNAENAANRWGVPVADTIEGRCDNCVWMVRLDGHADLLDYGVCTSGLSPFDGHAVNVASGCAAFTDDET